LPDFNLVKQKKEVENKISHIKQNLWLMFNEHNTEVACKESISGKTAVTFYYFDEFKKS